MIQFWNGFSDIFELCFGWMGLENQHDPDYEFVLTPGSVLGGFAGAMLIAFFLYWTWIVVAFVWSGVLWN